MKTLVAIFVAVLLAGCAAQQAALPAMPTITEVSATQAQLAAIQDPQGFFRAGATQIIAGCGGYFDQLVSLAQKNALTSTQVSGATQALSAILGLAQAAPGPISVLGVVGPAITGAIANAQAGSPGGDHPAEMSALVAAEMNAYLAAIGSPPTDPAAAWLELYGLFRTCSPAGIEAAKQQSLADAPNHIVVVPAAAASAVSAQSAPLPLQGTAEPAPTPSLGIPLVMVHTPRAPSVALAQAAPDAARARLDSEWRAVRKRGRNAVEGGLQRLPDRKPEVPPEPSSNAPATPDEAPAETISPVPAVISAPVTPRRRL